MAESDAKRALQGIQNKIIETRASLSRVQEQLDNLRMSEKSLLRQLGLLEGMQQITVQQMEKDKKAAESEKKDEKIVKLAEKEKAKT